jgi:hypothetical protein
MEGTETSAKDAKQVCWCSVGAWRALTTIVLWLCVIGIEAQKEREEAGKG